MDVMGGPVSCKNMTLREATEGAKTGSEGPKTCEFFETHRSYPQAGVFHLHGHRGGFSLKQTRPERTHYEHPRRHHTTTRTPAAPD